MKFFPRVVLCGLILLAGSALAAEPARPPPQWPVNLRDDTSVGASAWRLPDLRTWQEFWARHQSREVPPVPDLEHGSILVVAAGRRPTGGYRVEVVRAVKESDGWVVEFIVRQPKPRSFVTQALTYPAAVVVFPGMDIIRPQTRDVTPPPDEPERYSTQR